MTPINSGIMLKKQLECLNNQFVFNVYLSAKISFAVQYLPRICITLINIKNDSPIIKVPRTPILSN